MSAYFKCRLSSSRQFFWSRIVAILEFPSSLKQEEGQECHQKQLIQALTATHTHKDKYVHAHMHTRKHTHTHKDMNMTACICTCANTRAHAHTHTHTHLRHQLTGLIHCLHHMSLYVSGRPGKRKKIKKLNEQGKAEISNAQTRAARETFLLPLDSQQKVLNFCEGTAV